MGARTGEEFLKGLQARKREVWLGGERVDDVVDHPALTGAAHVLAAVFDRQHVYADDCLMPDPETGDAPLIGVSLCDRLSDGISMVYSFYDPDQPARSPAPT